MHTVPLALPRPRSWSWKRRRGSWSWLASWSWRQIDRMAFTPTGRLVNGLLQLGILGALAYAVGRRELRRSA